MAQSAREQYIVDEKGRPTAVILDIQKYRKMVSLVQERLDRKESKLLSQSKQFKKLVQEGLVPGDLYFSGQDQSWNQRSSEVLIRTNKVSTLKIIAGDQSDDITISFAVPYRVCLFLIPHPPFFLTHSDHLHLSDGPK
jgi:hypothetical protein